MLDTNVPDVLRSYAVQELEVGSVGVRPFVGQDDGGTTYRKEWGGEGWGREWRGKNGEGRIVSGNGGKGMRGVRKM